VPNLPKRSDKKRSVFGLRRPALRRNGGALKKRIARNLRGSAQGRQSVKNSNAYGLKEMPSKPNACDLKRNARKPKQNGHACWRKPKRNGHACWRKLNPNGHAWRRNGKSSNASAVQRNNRRSQGGVLAFLLLEINGEF
jgi:hypothetical protein